MSLDRQNKNLSKKEFTNALLVLKPENSETFTCFHNSFTNFICSACLTIVGGVVKRKIVNRLKKIDGGYGLLAIPAK